MSFAWLPRGIGRIGFAALVLAAGLLAREWLLGTPQQHGVSIADRVIGRTLELGMTTTLPGRSEPPGTVQRQGEPHLVNLFASWCIPCRAEAPVLARLKSRGVRIDAIAVRDEPAAVTRFLKSTGDPFTTVRLDPLGRVQAALGVTGLPETYAIDGRGSIMYRHRGALGPDDAAGMAQRLR